MIAFPRLRAAVFRVLSITAALVLSAAPALAQEAANEPVNLLAPKAGLMFWTLLIFAALFFVLLKFAFPPLFESVEAREKALEDAIEGAKRDRAAAAELLAQQQALLEQGRADAQRFIAESRATAEKMKTDMLAQTKTQQEEMLDAARRAIEGERAAAVAQLRKESVDLAIAGASRVIEQNLDSANNRRIVEQFLGSLDTSKAR